MLKSIEMTSSVELPKLPENQKSYAGIPEAVFVVNRVFCVNFSQVTNFSQHMPILIL